MRVDSLPLPQAIEMERALLGACIRDQAAFDLARTIMGRTRIYSTQNRLLWDAIEALADSDSPVDASTVTAKAEELGTLDKMGGPLFIVETSSEGSSANVEYYARTILNKAKLRDLYSACSEASSTIIESTGTADTVIDAVSAIVNKALDDAAKSGNNILSASEVMQAAVKRIEAIMAGTAEVGLRTGFSLLDSKLGGLRPGHLIVLGGRPSMGKTTLGLTIANRICITDQHRGLFCSLEAASSDIAISLLSSRADVDNNRVRDGAFQRSEVERIMASAGVIANSPLFIDDSSLQTVHQIRAKARIMHARSPLSVLFVDYLQLVKPDGAKAERRDIDVGEVSSGLKAIAKDLNIPVVALAQLNRLNEKREDPTPKLSDLRESGNIEQDADAVLLIHRPGYYKTDAELDERRETKLIVAKNRYGPVGVVPLIYKFEHSKFAMAHQADDQDGE